MPEHKNRLTLWIFIALVAAILTAVILPGFASSLGIGGDLFLRLLKMIVVPLVLVSVMSGMIGLGNIRQLARPGTATVGYYLCTTMLAIILGLILVNLIKPGAGRHDQLQAAVTENAPEDIRDASPAQNDTAKRKTADSIANEMAVVQGAVEQEKSIRDIFENLAFMLFTDNLLKAAVNVDLLPLIMFSIVFGGVLTWLGEKVATMRRLVLEANEAMMALVNLIMWLSPLGIYCLVAARFGTAYLESDLTATVQETGIYFMTVLSGLLIHGALVLPLIYWVLTRRNPYVYVNRIFQAVLLAFSTASSTATLPVTMRCVTDTAGVSKRSAQFVLPLGATINMDGTALYEAVAALFIAQAAGIELGWTGNIVVALTATLASIGAAGIPQAGLVTMVIVLKAAGLPADPIYLAPILVVDWLLDRFRTAVNVEGDSIGAAVVEPMFDGHDLQEAYTRLCLKTNDNVNSNIDG